MGDAEGSDDGLELFGEEKTQSMVTKKTRGELFEEHYLRCKIETNEDTFVKQKGGSLSLEGVGLGKPNPTSALDMLQQIKRMASKQTNKQQGAKKKGNDFLY